ncbi:hypothetical protein CRG98_038461, partial [Punica granatum]
MAFVPEDESRFRNEQNAAPLYDEGSPYFTIEYHHEGKLKRGRAHTVYDGVNAMEGQERTKRESVEDIVSDFNDSDFDINDDVEEVEANVAMAEGIRHEGEGEEADHETQSGEVEHEEVEGGETQHEEAACREAEHEEAEGGEPEHEETEWHPDLECAWEASDHGDESDGFQSVHSDDEDGSRQRLPKFRPERDMKDPKFQRGMLFATMKVLKQAVRHYVILNKVNVVFEKNHKDRVNAKCKNCEWILRASLNKKHQAIQIKKFRDEHTCGKEVPTRFVSYRWISKEYHNHITADPTWSHKSFAHQLDHDYKVRCNRVKLWRARRHGLNMLRTSDDEQYAKLRDYAGELTKTNPGTTVNIGNLAQDLEIQNSRPWTFMGDKEKGLVQSLKELFPDVEKRFCTRHLWKNLCTIPTIKKGKDLKDLLWTAARATYAAEFFRAMEVFKREDEKAWQWLQDKVPSQWSKSHFRPYPKCDVILNNHCECFNRWIIEARDKPILTLLETIRTQLMKMMVLKRKVAEKYTESGAEKFSVSVGEKLYV